VNFAARLPSFLLNIALIILTGKMVKKAVCHFTYRVYFTNNARILIHTGVVSTDTAYYFV
jgi:hypothetical protein